MDFGIAAIFIIFGLLCLALSIDVLDSTQAEELQTIGTIKDFTISAGGFGASTRCTITLEDGKVISGKGSECSDLASGKRVVLWKSFVGNIRKKVV